jgi:hypothetical protein
MRWIGNSIFVAVKTELQGSVAARRNDLSGLSQGAPSAAA